MPAAPRKLSHLEEIAEETRGRIGEDHEDPSDDEADSETAEAEGMD